MELERDPNKTPRTSRDGNQQSMINMTILSTPRPQATSTVERRTFGSHYSDALLDYRNPPSNHSITSHTPSIDSSLGLVYDISSRSIIDESTSTLPSTRHETQRKLARELLQKLDSQVNQNPMDPNKENNVNSQNLTDDTPSTLINSLDTYSQNPLHEKDQTLLSSSVPKTSINSVHFEPNEITGRSSSKSRSPVTSPSKYKTDGFSFNSTAAELMAKFTNEEFLSGSRMNSQISSDEISWNQNYNPIPPTADRERLDFSCFSGIIGDLDLSLESSPGCRVSVGEFFGRKCEPMGHLSGSESFQRPAFGLEIKSPKRLSKPGALVNLTTMSNTSTASKEGSNPQGQETPVERFYTTCTTSCIDDTRDEDEEPLISLSGIARALDSNDETPRRLVDQLLLVKKKEKEQKERKPVEAGNCTGGTYTLQSARSSLPLFASETPQSTVKLSLDSKTLNPNASTLNQNASTWSLPTSIPSSSFNFDNKPSDKSNEPGKSSPVIPKVPTTPTTPSSPFYSKESIQKLITQNPATLEYPAILNSSELPGAKKESKIRVKSDYSIKREINSPSGGISSGKINNTSVKNPTDKLRIASNAEGLYKCIIGVARDADIEMINESDRWLICSLHLLQIQGDKDNIHLEIPDYTVLIKPSQSKIFKIVVKLLKMTGPVMAALNINCIDMTTRESFTKHHMMCFVPCDAQVDIINPVGHDSQLNFNDGRRELSVTLMNKYDTDVPLELFISNNDEELFNLKIPVDSNAVSDDNKPVIYLILKANGKSVINVRYIPEKKNKNLKKLGEEEKCKLIIRVHNEMKNGSILGEIPLIVDEENDEQDKQDKGDKEQDITQELEETRTYSRCDTPRNHLVTSLPSSPQSISSSTSAGISTSACNKSGRASPRSHSSAGTVAGDTIPIQSTHSSLTWTTVKVGKYEIKEFTIRNTSSNKIKLQAIITDNDKSFKFLKDRESSTSIIVGLQRMESRTLTIVYSPNRTGASAGKITFVHYEMKIKRSPGDAGDGRERDTRPSRVITLYGYGGYAKVNINQALKIMGTQMWLSLGKLNSTGTLTSTVQLENSGDLPAYARIKLTPKAVYPAVETSWHVEPNEIILGPKESQWITIEFKPRKEDISLLRGDVADMGTLTITHGDEPTRWRIRRLYWKLIETGQINDKQNDVFINVVHPICRIFTDEMQIPQLSIIRDAVQDLGILCRNVHRQVVTLMMDLNSDETISVFSDDGDESQMFQSLCSDTSVISVNNEDSYMPSGGLLEKTLVGRQRVFNEEFSVTPVAVTLNPPCSKDATVMIMSTSSTAQPFETKLTDSEFLSVVPAGGMIPAKRGVLIKIQCKKNVDRTFQSILHIFTSNERRDVKIQVVPKRH